MEALRTYLVRTNGRDTFFFYVMFKRSRYNNMSLYHIEHKYQLASEKNRVIALRKKYFNENFHWMENLQRFTGLDRAGLCLSPFLDASSTPWTVKIVDRTYRIIQVFATRCSNIMIMSERANKSPTWKLKASNNRRWIRRSQECNESIINLVHRRYFQQHGLKLGVIYIYHSCQCSFAHAFALAKDTEGVSRGKARQSWSPREKCLTRLIPHAINCNCVYIELNNRQFDLEAGVKAIWK